MVATAFFSSCADSLVAMAAQETTQTQESERAYDVVVYGGTSAGVIAAVRAKQQGRSVVLVSPDQHLGGMSSGGLGWTDSGDKSVIGGLSRDFYRRIKKHYDRPEAWRQQEPGDYRYYRPADDAMWVFEPHVAEQVFEDYVREFEIPVYRDAWLDRENGVRKTGNRIVSITTLNGLTFQGSVFIDCTYEGDLMAAAGVSYHVGRESNATYGETLNGVQKARARFHQFQNKISPYVVPGDPASGLLPRVHDEDPGQDGAGDHRVQAYNFRLCLTNDPSNRAPFPQPDDYDARQYELLLRDMLAGSRHVFGKFDPVPNRKTDTNNHGSFSTDNIGMNYDYPEAGYERRKQIIAEHESYQKGYFYFLTHDPRVPEDVRTRMNQWGLAKDEFEDNGHWPHQIYVREARRMVSDFVMTELHLRGKQLTPEPIGMGSYNMDSHHTQRYIATDENGRAYVQNEGDIEVNPGGPYPISYRAIVPKRAECENLLVPVCLSSSHIAYGSIRMEPVFMLMGDAAAFAAVLALADDVAVQDVPYERLREKLLEAGQVLPADGTDDERPDERQPKDDRRDDRRPRPVLQVINGSRQPVDVFWLKSQDERVPNGTVEPGKETFITTTLGHRFALVGREDGFEMTVTSQVPIQAVRFDPPDENGIPAFYTQRISAGGLPIVASERVNPYAIKEAAYLVDLMLAKRPDLRQAMIASGSRLCVLAYNEFTTDLPEFARLGERPMRQFPGISGRDYWDARARGLGGSDRDPFCSCAEENLLAYPGDPYAAECILIHELAHNIHLRGMNNVDPTFDRRLKAAYDAAMAAGLWKGKYASVNRYEYFAEGVQSWFDDNRENDHDHNHVNTRQELIEYDSRLAEICREVFGDTELKYTKPTTRLTGHLQGYDPATAPTFEWPPRLREAKKQILQAARERDGNKPTNQNDK